MCLSVYGTWITFDNNFLAFAILVALFRRALAILYLQDPVLGHQADHKAKEVPVYTSLRAARQDGKKGTCPKNLSNARHNTSLFEFINKCDF
jgi:hypothetical protein